MAHIGDGTVILVTRDGMGDAPGDLRASLAKSYFTMLAEGEVFPDAMCFYGEGVKLVLDDSAVLEPLRALESKGVRLIACTTCLSYFDAMERLAVGVAGGMPGVIEAQFGAGKVITI